MPEHFSSAGWLLAIYCALALGASLAGGWLILFIHLTHTRLQVAISFVAGLMLGIALLHFLPDAAAQLHSLPLTVNWMLGGFLTMFFLQRFLHFHHHDVPPRDTGEPLETDETLAHEHEHHHHDHGHHHEHGHEHHDHGAGKKSHELSWIGTTAGLTLHSLLDGLAMGAAVAAGAAGHIRLAGLGVALAVILHKPFDSMTVSTLMTASEKSKLSRHVLNALFALVTPLGAALFYLGAHHFAGSSAVFLGGALAFCSGTFLCISSSDLLPELQFHSHDRFKLSVALLVGLGVAILIGMVESDKPDANSTTRIEIPLNLAAERADTHFGRCPAGMSGLYASPVLQEKLSHAGSSVVYLLTAK